MMHAPKYTRPQGVAVGLFEVANLASPQITQTCGGRYRVNVEKAQAPALAHIPARASRDTVIRTATR